MAVGGHLDLHLLLGQAVEGTLLLAHRPHQVRVGVLVAHAQEAVLGVIGAERQGHVGHEVVVVAELLRLRRRGLVGDVEGRRVAEHLVAPADQNLGAIAGRGLHAGGHVVGDLLEAERGGPGHGPAHMGQEAGAQSAGRRRRRQARKRGAPAQAQLDQFRQRRLCRGIGRNVVVLVVQLLVKAVLIRVLAHGSSPPRQLSCGAAPARYPDLARGPAEGREKLSTKPDLGKR
jgi:hypothetical protein